MKKAGALFLTGALMLGLFAGCDSDSKGVSDKSDKKNDSDIEEKEADEADEADENKDVSKDKDSKEKDKDENPDAMFEPYQLFIDEMTEEKVFDLCHSYLSLTYTDGQTDEELIASLPAAQMDIIPFDSSVNAGGIKFEYQGVVQADVKRNYLAEFNISCEYDYDSHTLTNLDGPVLERCSSIRLYIYDDKGQELYDYFKEQYIAMYPDYGTEEKLGDNWVDIDSTNEEGPFFNLRLEHDVDKDILFIEEGNLVVNN